MVKAVDIKQICQQALNKKARRLEVQKQYLKILNQLKNLLSNIRKTDVTEVIGALTKSKDLNTKIKDIENSYEHFESYVTHTSQQKNEALCDNIFYRFKTRNFYDLYRRIDYEIQRCKKELEPPRAADLQLFILYENFEDSMRNLIFDVRIFIDKLKHMNINDVIDVNAHLKHLKNQVKCALQNKWSFQMELIPVVSSTSFSINNHETTKVMARIGRARLITEHMKESLHFLRILDNIEFNKNFSVMSGMCELRDKRDILLFNFRNFLVKTSQRAFKDVPDIKKKLLEFNKEIQVLLYHYNKYRVKLQFLTTSDLKIVNSMFEDVESIILSDAKAFQQKRAVGILSMMGLNAPATEAYHRKAEEALKEIEKGVDEVKDFLHMLDETMISKNFSAMRYLCELHEEKEGILCSLETTLELMQHLNTEDQEEIANHFNEFMFYAENLLEKYERLGLQLMIFSDLMEIIAEENNPKKSYPGENDNDG